VRVRGTNIAVYFPEVASADQTSDWSAMWRVWNWAGRIQPQLDDAATIANCVRTIGNTHVVTSGNISQATYLARWTQFLDYTVTKGLYVYPCGGDLHHWGTATTYAAATTLFTAWADLLAGYSNVIAVDITNEAWGQSRATGTVQYSRPEPYADLLSNLTSIVRRRSGKPVTNSMGIWDSTAWPILDNELVRLFKMSDFIDLHIYDDAATTTLVDTYMSRPFATGKQLLIGEFGGLDPGATGRVARYTNAATLVNASTNNAGALAWSNWDLGTGATTLSGLFNASRALRTDISTPFATLPTTR
jgi:hypothetical protein